METISPGRVRLTAGGARALAASALMKAGADEEQAGITAEHAVDAALCGYEYLGLPKLPNLIEHNNLCQPRRRLKGVHETPVSAMVDGGNSCGMYARMRAAEMSIACAGLIGIHTVSSTLHVTPPEAAKAAYGTYPLSFGFLTAGEPFVIDHGTSAFMSTDLQFRERRGDPFPEGVAVDTYGRPTRDAKAVRKGAYLAFGGYKGFALAMAAQALDVFAGSGNDQEQNYGYSMIAMKPDLLMPLADYRRQLSENLPQTKATPRQPGVRHPTPRRAFVKRTRKASRPGDCDRPL